MTTYDCPYGCGAKFAGKHLKCKGEFLPEDKVIDLTMLPPRLGGLPADTPPAPGAKKMEQCPDCKDYFIHLRKHTKCRGAPMAEPEQRRIILPKEDRVPEFDYSKLLFWSEPLKVNDRVFKDWEELAEYFLSLEQRLVMMPEFDSAWLHSLTSALSARGTQPNITPGKSYAVKGKFELRCVGLYMLSELTDVVPVSRYLYQLTGQNLVDHWTLASFGYQFWKVLAKSVDRLPVKCLQGAEYKFSKASYYSGRQTCQTGTWRSSLADQIEAGELSFAELEGKADADIYYQLDATSLYPAVMRSIDKLEVYYPGGEAQYHANAGQAEFEKGSIGLYQVRYQRPEGLAMGILPSYVNGQLSWVREAGEGQGVYTNVDIELGQKYGYRFEFQGPCLVWSRKMTPFKTYVDILFAEKDKAAKAKDEGRYSITKGLLNTLTGKLSQSTQGSAEKKRREVSEDEALDYMEKGVDCEERDGKWFLVKGDGTETEYNNRPNHLGCFLLSWSRVLMTRYLDCVGFRSRFTHTDCARVSAEDYVKLKEAGYVGEKQLGLLNLDYGLIYEYNQDNMTNYQLKVLTPEGELKVIGKGKKYLHAVQN